MVDFEYDRIFREEAMYAGDPSGDALSVLEGEIRQESDPVTLRIDALTSSGLQKAFSVIHAQTGATRTPDTSYELPASGLYHNATVDITIEAGQVDTILALAHSLGIRVTEPLNANDSGILMAALER